MIPKQVVSGSLSQNVLRELLSFEPPRSHMMEIVKKKKNLRDVSEEYRHVFKKFSSEKRNVVK